MKVLYSQRQYRILPYLEFQKRGHHHYEIYFSVPKAYVSLVPLVNLLIEKLAIHPPELAFNMRGKPPATTERVL